MTTHQGVSFAGHESEFSGYVKVKIKQGLARWKTGKGGKPIDTSKFSRTCLHALLHTQVMTRTLPRLNSNIVPLLRPSIYMHAVAFETSQGTNVLISVSLFMVNNLSLRTRLLMCHHNSNRPVTSQPRLGAWCNGTGSSNNIHTCFKR